MQNIYVANTNTMIIVNYYDFLLGSIPLVLGGIVGGGTFLGIGLLTTITLGSVVAFGLILHGLFVNGPVSQASPSVSETPPESVSPTPASRERSRSITAATAD